MQDMHQTSSKNRAILLWSTWYEGLSTFLFSYVLSASWFHAHSCLHQDETPEGSEETAEEWHEDANEIPSLLWAKVDTLKLFRHRCLNAAVAAIVAARNNESAGNANGKGKGKAKEADPEKEKEKAEKIVGPVVKMLQALMVHEGAMSEGVREEYVFAIVPRILMLTAF